MKKIIKLSSILSLFALVLFVSCTKNDVQDVTTKITLNKSTSDLILGETDSLLATFTTTSGNTKNISQSWSSSNITVASVVNGVVTALTAGTTTITITSGNQSATCNVTVIDKILPSLTQGELDYFGDVYNTKDSINGTGSNNFILYLAGPNIDLATFQGSGEMLVIELNTPLTVKDSIPSGTYDMITDLSDIKNFKPLTLVPGYIDPKTNYSWGCWYYGNISDLITIGNIVVSRVNTTYTIAYEFYDDYGVKISGTYNGTLSYLDATKASAVKSANSRMKLKSLSHPNKIMKFNRR